MSLICVNTLRSITRRSFSMRALLAVGGDGSGVGHGGGSGGSIREAGGKFGEKEASIENAYFIKLQAEQLAALRKRHDEEIKHHEEEIKRHKEAIEKHRSLKRDMDDKSKNK